MERNDESISRRQALAAMPSIPFEREPGYTLSYSGPGGRGRSGSFD